MAGLGLPAGQLGHATQRVVERLARRLSTGGGIREPPVELSAIRIREHDAAGARDRLHGLDASRPWKRHDQVRQIHQPRQCDFERRGVMPARDRRQRRIRGSLAAP